MKRRVLFQISTMCILLLSGIVLTKAQGGAISFKSGITVATKTETTPKSYLSPPINSYETGSPEGNIIYRIISDEKNKTYFGYDLEVREADEKGKYIVSIKPLSTAPAKSAKVEGFTAKSLPKYPDPVKVSEGDTISLDVMENPQTKVKVTDYIKVFYKPGTFTDFFPEDMPVRGFTIDDVGLQLIDFEVFADNQSIVKVGSGASGSNVWLYLKGKGRFIFSLFPRAGYDFQKIGAIEGNKILFKYDGVDYKITSSQPIVGYSGHWNLWVLHDPTYRSPFRQDIPYSVGASDKVEFLFPKQ